MVHHTNTANNLGVREGRGEGRGGGGRKEE